VATYSIVARDPATGDLGVAVQSHWFSVGSMVPWAEAGVGAVATQSFVDPSYGPLGLALMRAGRSAPDALGALLAGDAQRDVRQVGMVDAQGRVATHTGALCIPAAGGQAGREYVVQANLMEKPSVWPAMARAFEAAKGDLAERMLAALDAAEAEGGDIRGRQAAGLVVVKARSSGRPWADRVFDLRVDDHVDPLGELRRLVRLQRAYNHMSAGDDCVTTADWACAEREYGAARALEPGHDPFIHFGCERACHCRRILVGEHPADRNRAARACPQREAAGQDSRGVGIVGDVENPLRVTGHDLETASDERPLQAGTYGVVRNQQARLG